MMKGHTSTVADHHKVAKQYGIHVDLEGAKERERDREVDV